MKIEEAEKIVSVVNKYDSIEEAAYQKSILSFVKNHNVISYINFHCSPNDRIDDIAVWAEN